MNTLMARSAIVIALAAAGVSCATVPRGAPPDVVRLQNDLSRLHDDPRISRNGGVELGNADVAVDTLSRNDRALDARTFQQAVYLSDKLVKIAEATALARYAESQGSELGLERDRLLLSGSEIGNQPIARSTGAYRSTTDRPFNGGEPSRATLLTMQAQLTGLETTVDDRGLVVRLGDFMFEPDRSALTADGQRSLDSLALSMRQEPSARARIGAIAAGDGGSTPARAEIVRDYLVNRGVEDARVDLLRDRIGERTAGGRPRVEIIVNARIAPLARN